MITIKTTEEINLLREGGWRLAEILAEVARLVKPGVTGKELDTVAFSEYLGEKRDHGLSVTFVIGGAYGLDDRVRERADLVLSLSKMTLPHELCRLVFLEALYRSLDVLRGGKYHHA